MAVARSAHESSVLRSGAPVKLETHREVMQHMQPRETALKRETDELKALLTANNELTRQDKELTERVEALARAIHTHLGAAS